MRRALEANRAAVTVASVVTSMTAISMTGTPEVVTPATPGQAVVSEASGPTAEVETEHPTAVPDTKRYKKSKKKKNGSQRN